MALSNWDTLAVPCPGMDEADIRAADNAHYGQQEER